jgi:hypothetical protein
MSNNNHWSLLIAKFRCWNTCRYESITFANFSSTFDYFALINHATSMTVFTLIGHVRHKVYILNILLRIFGETSNYVSNTVRAGEFPYPVCSCIANIYLKWRYILSYCTWTDSSFLKCTWNFVQVDIKCFSLISKFSLPLYTTSP